MSEPGSCTAELGWHSGDAREGLGTAWAALGSWVGGSIVALSDAKVLGMACNKCIFEFHSEIHM